jgi:tripartite-type tricarboxylate transporter receptor subunit TctC
MCKQMFSAGLALGLSVMASAAYAQESPYKGAQINFVVSADAGNSYDMFARMIGRYLPKHIPGQPTVIVQNMPGAGGMRAMNWLYNVAPKDGNTIGMVNNTLAINPLYGDKQAQFDAAK